MIRMQAAGVFLAVLAPSRVIRRPQLRRPARFNPVLRAIYPSRTTEISNSRIEGGSVGQRCLRSPQATE
ncbi:MAG: hypothetical protein CL933_16740 [Deltaproteobacteria bacterium]|nr:hypothetical protein [Deltaproteobacteria bacterium]